MIVIADASPINYLIILGEIDILPQLYGRVIIADGVLEELTSAPAPDEVIMWLNARPTWLEVRSLEGPIAPDLVERLDKGESESIQLAVDLDADILLIDEKRGRRLAVERGFKVVGVLGILILADEKGLVNFEDAVQKLITTNFYVSEAILKRLRNER